MSAQVETVEKILNPKSPGERLQSELDKACETAETVLTRTRNRAVKIEHDLEEYVRERPLKSALIATGVGVGLGLVLGVLLARR